MNTIQQHTRRAGAGLCALALAGGATLVWDTPARAAAPESLAVFFASSAATPVGVVSRVPAETGGGFAYSKSLVQLGKSQALAAAFTLGELGDLFVVSSSPPGTLAAMPSVVTAQEPPSESSPRESTLSAGQSGAPGLGEVRNADFAARAADSPSGNARAAGHAITTPAFTTGASTSRSDSVVQPDGTVTTTGITSLQDITIGNAAAPLTIATLQSIATVTVPPGGKPVTDLQIRMSGAQLAGVPVVIDAGGVHVADQVPVPASSFQQVNTALEGLAAQGITVVVTPVQRTETATGGQVSGSALSVRYVLPDGPVPKPSNVGSDETFELGSVFAKADARARGDHLDGPLTPAGSVPASTGSTTAPSGGVDDVSAGFPVDLGGTVPPVGGVAGVSATPVASVPFDTLMPARTSSLLPDAGRDGYRFLLLAAGAGVAGVLFVIRKTSLA
ncbi:MAG TPA: hypothetical protein VMZ00_16190 [Sporichthya sp.]|nr:hypothetical protein [Sporichthya sp.]